jgi:hypothetical protein
MRRVPVFFVMMLLAFTAMATPGTASAQTASAQTELAGTVRPFIPSQPAAIFGPAVNAAVNPDMVIARLMTFDRDNDGRLVKSELPERMQNLLAADASGDQALDPDEIRALARPAPPAVVAASLPGLRGGGNGGYTFGDQVSLSTRAHVEGALDDLRLTPVAHQQALAIVRPFMARLEATATAALVQELEGQMSSAQLDRFKILLDRQMSGNNMPMPIKRIAGEELVQVNIFRLFGPDLAQVINSFALPPHQTKLAIAAFEGFKERLRPAGADRTALLDELKNALNDEERENFGAALQRRPLVKAGGVIAGVVGGFPPRLPSPPPGDLVDGPAVFRLPFPPQRQVLQP